MQIQLRVIRERVNCYTMLLGNVSKVRRVENKQPLLLCLAEPIYIYTNIIYQCLMTLMSLDYS